MSKRVSAPRAPAPRAARAPSGPAAAVRTPAWAWLALVAVAVLVAVARVRLLDVPLERDEGEYAYAGQLILRGIPPYQLVYNMKLPGAYAVYALFLALFGQTARGVHLGLLLVTLASITLLFLVARRLFGARAGVVAAATYGLLSMSGAVFGLAAHSSHLVVLCALAGLHRLLAALDSGRRRDWFWSGLCFGLAFLMKQHGLAFVLFGIFALAALARAPRRARNGAVFLAGAALPFLATCLILAATGVFASFWFWTFQYAAAYVSQLTPAQGLQNLRVIGLERVVAAAPLLWSLAAAGLVVLLADRSLRAQRGPVGGFTAFAFLATCPGLYFREHYFIMLLPAVALLAGVAIDALARALSKGGFRRGATVVSGALFLALFLASLFPEAKLLFFIPPRLVPHAIYSANPFPEAREIARYIAARSSPTDRIAVLGSEPEICFYARRLSATGHIYMYGLMEHQPYAATMQRQAIREIERSAPQWLVFVNATTSWNMRPDSEPGLFEWYPRYLDQHYRPAGLVQVLTPETTTYEWSDTVKVTDARAPTFVMVYRRKPPA